MPGQGNRDSSAEKRSWNWCGPDTLNDMRMLGVQRCCASCGRPLEEDQRRFCTDMCRVGFLAVFGDPKRRRRRFAEDYVRAEQSTGEAPDDDSDE